MKILKLISNGEFSLETGKIPKLKHHHSLVKIIHVGICSSDIKRSFGHGAYFYPLVMGHEAMGYITKSTSKKFTEGDKVVVFPLLPCFKCEDCLNNQFQTCKSYKYYGSRQDGAYQEFLLVNNWNLLKLPKSLCDADAALVEPMAVMVHVKNILLNMLDDKESILKSKGAVIGGGFLTMVFAKILQHMGAVDFIVFDRNEYKIKFGKKHGINSKINSKLEAKNFDSRFDWVVEASGDPNAYSTSLRIAKTGGKVIWMSNVLGDVKLQSSIVSSILRKELSIKGSWNSTYHPSRKSDWHETIKLMENGISPSDFVTHYITLEEVPTILKKFHLHKKRKVEFQSIKAMVRN